MRQDIQLKTGARSFRYAPLILMVFILGFSLACLATPTPKAPTADPRTEIARQVASTSSAEKTAAAIEVGRARLELTSAVLKLTQAAMENPTPTQITPQPTYTFFPTYTPLPSATQPAPTSVPSKPTTVPPAATATRVPDSYPVTVSTKLFYCYKEPSQLKISVEMPDINKGAALYFRLRDKTDGRVTNWGNKDLRRDTGNFRSVTINGSAYSGTLDIIYPALMHESIFEMQVITDDGTYRSKVYTDVSYAPCAQ